MKAIFKTAYPYKDDRMNLPVENVAEAVPFYETVMGFKLVSRTDSPARAVLARDEIEIGLVENGGDPSKEGCFFEVDDVERAYDELQANGLGRKDAKYDIQSYGGTRFKVFFVVAPDGLCYCLGQRQS